MSDKSPEGTIADAREAKSEPAGFTVQGKPAGDAPAEGEGR